VRIDPDTLPLPTEPYRGILPFRLLDWRVFLERESETEHLGNHVSMYGAVLLYGQSGTGKSSLLNAGLLPDALRHGRAPERIRVFPERSGALIVERILIQEEHEPQLPGVPTYLPSRFASASGDDRVAMSCEEFKRILFAPSELGIPLLLFDQFEELVTLFEENPKDKVRFDEARAARREIELLLRDLLLHQSMPLKIVFAFRDDYLARLTPIFSSIPDLLDQRVLLVPPRVELVKQIVRGPFVKSADGERGLPGHFHPELSEELAEKIAAGISARRLSGLINLSEMQMLCLGLWRHPARCEQLLRAPDPAAVLGKIIESESLSPIKDFRFQDKLRTLALLSNLVTEDGTRDVVSEENLIRETTRNPLLWMFRGNLRKLLGQLLEKTGLLRRSLSGGNTYYELTSEFLIPWIQKQKQQLRMLGLMIWGYAFLGLIVLLVLMGYFAHQANVKSRDAEKARETAVAAKKDADALVAFMQYDLSDSLGEPDRLKIMDTINARILKYYDEHPAEANDLDALREKAVAFFQHGDVQRAQRDFQGALMSYRDSLAIFDTLTKRDPGNALWQRDLAIGYEKLGNVQSDLGDWNDALKNYEDGLPIREKLALADPGNPGRQRDLSVGYELVGDAKRDLGDRTGALKSYQASLAIRAKLGQGDFSNADLQRDLSLSYERIGDMQRDLGDRSAALKSYKDSLAIRAKLADAAPGNADRRRDLALSKGHVADVQYALNDYAGALKNYRESLAIGESLATQDPGNAAWQSDLAYWFWRVGNTWARIDSTARTDSRAMVVKGRDILRGLKQRGPLTDWQKGLLDEIEANLRTMDRDK
jgi:tetratricopeptide (TPR) repeat protein